MKKNRMKKLLLVISTAVSAIFFFLSVSSLYVETDMLDGSFHTPWFSWQVDAVGVYFLTAAFCLVTARLGTVVFHKNEEDNYEVLIEG